MQKITENYEEYFRLVYGFLLGLTDGNHHLTEELTQETFYRAVKNSESFKGESKVSTWLCQIAKYTFYQYLEKKKKTKEILLKEEEKVRDFPSPEEQITKKERKVEIYSLVQKLPNSMKEVFLYRLTGDLSFREIGEICGKTENWARVTYYRAKQQLGKELKEEDE